MPPKGEKGGGKGENKNKSALELDKFLNKTVRLSNFA